MNLFTWGEKKIQSFNIWDFAVFKVYLFFLGMMAGAYFSSFVLSYFWDFTILVVASLAWILYKIFRV
ncbi:hypothetical protein C0584_00500 [Candidatus Parcubacteria bacterium]|nr:MAG: hypothetical protein C0584_00500 [Candidatus Parcubacteria bacterium]